jgi:hypothetical protein
MNHHPQRSCLLALALTSRGLGYAVLEGETSLIENGHTSIRKSDKNAKCLAKVAKLAALYRPDALILEDVAAKGSRRHPRIKRLHREVEAFAKKRKLAFKTIPAQQSRRLLLGNEHETKQEMAEGLAKRFPIELAFQLPPKRRLWESEDSRMDIFDAVGLAVAYRTQKTKAPLTTRDKCA